MNWEGRGELNSLLGPSGCDGTPDLDLLDPSILPNHPSSEPRKKRHKNILYGFRAITSWTLMHLRRFIGFVVVFWFKTFKLITLAIKEARRRQFSAHEMEGLENHHKLVQPQASIYQIYVVFMLTQNGRTLLCTGDYTDRVIMTEGIFYDCKDAEYETNPFIRFIWWMKSTYHTCQWSMVTKSEQLKIYS